MRDAGKIVSTGLLTAVVLLCYAGQARAAEPLDPDSAVRIALENHPMVAAADSAVAEAQAGLDLARTGYLPRLDLTEHYARSTNPVFVFGSKLGQEVFGPDDFAIEALNTPGAFTNAATRLSLEQNIWDAGRTRLGARTARLGVEAADMERRWSREGVAFRALLAFWDTVLADEMLVVSRDAEEAARANFELAVELVEEGVAVPSDRMSAEVRLAEVRAMRADAERRTEVARAVLAVALGLGDAAPFELAPPPIDPVPSEIDPDLLAEQAIAARTDLGAVDRRVLQAEAGERIARSGRLPVIGAAAQYEMNDTDPFGAAGDNWTVGISVRLPLFDGFETRAHAAMARAARRRAEQMRRALADGIRMEVRAAWADRRAAAERLAVAESALAQSAEALRIVRERYAEGMAVMVELLGAEAAHTRTRAVRVQAVRDLALAGAALDRAIGRPLTVNISKDGERDDA